jgi:hypothetical protein
MGRLGKYSGDALNTMEKITGNITTYEVNKVYKNTEYNIYWFINQNGYIHVLRPCKITIDGKVLHYSIEDNLLTKDNMLKSKGNSGDYKTVDEVLEELERRVA